MIFLQVRRNSKRYAVTVAFLYRTNDARMHAYDLLGSTTRKSAQR